MSRTKLQKFQKVLPAETEKISKISESKNVNANELLKCNLPVIICGCGTEILVVPDLKAMNCAIRTHVTEHRKNLTLKKNSVLNPSNISELLSQLLLRKISEQNVA